MSSHFSYSLLSYVHSDLLEERLNIGILFIFSDGRVAFKAPTNYARIRSAYGNFFSGGQLTGVLRAIDAKVKNYNLEFSDKGQARLMFDSPGEVVERFLRPDATALRFSPIKTSLVYANNEKIVADFYNLYFSYYEQEEDTRQRKDEEYISKSIRKILISQNSEVLKYINQSPEIQAHLVPEGKVSFDFSWKNEVYHYVKPIGFDLQDAQNISQKATMFYGYFSAIQSELGDRKIDVVTSKPNFSSLLPSYHKAIDMITAANANINVIEQDNYQSYANEIIENIEKHKFD